MGKILRLIFAPLPSYRGSLGLLALRIIAGAGIILHGYAKIHNISGFASAMNIPVPLAALSVFTEFLGGMFILAGFLTPLAALMLCGNMLVATVSTINGGAPFLMKSGVTGWEFPAIYLAIFFAILTLGPGRFSLDAVVFRKHHR